MTAKELIKKLKELPQDMRIIVDGYEGGVDDIDELEIVSIKLDVNPEGYYGDHNECKEHEEDEKAFLISR